MGRESIIGPSATTLAGLFSFRGEHATDRLSLLDGTVGLSDWSPRLRWLFLHQRRRLFLSVPNSPHFPHPTLTVCFFLFFAKQWYLSLPRGSCTPAWKSLRSAGIFLSRLLSSRWEIINTDASRAGTMSVWAESSPERRPSEAGPGAGLASLDTAGVLCQGVWGNLFRTGVYC